ncbi:hypothetical protein BD311DRAFT_742256 [Dichomitus squalens]|uniref:Uncharacterized protein n=1 Tax=Dichomitus squalens TaxID=114155 RepID=A0A4Q9M9G4_9APHY|nr:hypothetical protein BD311DRAFT_742256 [Dichomitus squalens]
MAELPPYESGAAVDTADISVIGLDKPPSVGGANQAAPSNAFAGPHSPMLNPYDDPANVYGQQQKLHYTQRGSSNVPGLETRDTTGLGAVGGAPVGGTAAPTNHSQLPDGGKVGPSAQEQHPPLAIWIESRTQPLQVGAVPASPSPSDYTDNMSISSSIIPPSYHTHYSHPDLPSYLPAPPSSNHGSTQEPRAPPSAFTANRSHPPPLPFTSQEDQFADSRERAGGASDGRRVLGDDWDYQISGLDVMLLPEYGENV